MPLLTNVLPFARELTRRVAHDLLAMQDELKVSTSKGSAVDVVTKADGHAEAMLTDALHRRFPLHRVAGEEGTRLGPDDAEWTWHIDPLDGTANYSRGLPYWAVSVGLSQGDQPQLGVIVGPAAGLDLAGIVGVGAWSGDQPLPATTPPGEPKTWIIATDWPWALNERQRTNRFLDHLSARVRQYKTYGSAACDFANLALGKVDAYAISHIFPWDQCGGAAIALALGHDLRRWDGTPWDLRHPDICAGRPGMWEVLAPGLV